jgi:hypothetical protein
VSERCEPGWHRLFAMTDPDGDAIDVNVNYSFGPTVTVFIRHGESGKEYGVRLTSQQGHEMVRAVNSRLD